MVRGESMDVMDYKLDKAAFDMWLTAEAGDNLAELSRVRRIVPLVLDECVTVTQKTYIMHHFIDRMSVSDIAEMYGVNKSTVSRTIHRGLDKAYKYLRFVSPLFIHAPQKRTYLQRYKKENVNDRA